MQGNRFFFYSVIINMVSSVVIFVPRMLIEGRFDGTLTSILLSIVVGMTLLITFTKSMETFNGLTFPQVLAKQFPRWVVLPFVLYLAMFWYVFGTVGLLEFVEITKRYLSPESSQLMITGYFALLILLVTPIRSGAMLRGLEVLFFVSIPTVFLVLLKTITEQRGDWLGAMDVVTHIANAPSYHVVAGVTYVFCGYTNFVVLNDTVHFKIKTWHYMAIGLMALVNLLTSYFLPIIRLGEFSVDRYVFPWIATADSVSMRYFAIERLGVPFLLLYLMVTMATSSLILHIGFRLIKSQFPVERKWMDMLILGIFAIGIFVVQNVWNKQDDLYHLISFWMNIRLPSEAVLVGVAAYLAKKARAA